MGCPSLCCEHMSFLLVDKAALAYSKTGNQHRSTGDDGQSGEEYQPATHEERCQSQPKKKDAKTEVTPWPHGDTQISRNGLISQATGQAIICNICLLVIIP